MLTTLEKPFPVVDPLESIGAAYRDDVYRDDPYRYDTEDPTFARLADSDDLRRIDYLPTPAEIAGVCAEIRSGWTLSEKKRRFVGELPAEAHEETCWAPPVIDTSQFRVSGSGRESS